MRKIYDFTVHIGCKPFLFFSLCNHLAI
uniref:Uncharacterized protein n=1 Tax=Arundo donax TaxID=35708 RepID=A0A0A9A6U4_ARUDO